MKTKTYPWILALILCLVGPSTIEAALAPELQAEMRNASADEIFEAIVQMDVQVELAPLKGRPSAIITALRTTATDTQRPLMDLLERLSATDARISYRSFWIINAVVVKGTREVIERIARVPEVGTVFLSHEIAPPELPPAVCAPKSLPKAGYTWGLEMIRADEVHQGTPGYDGTGVIIGSIDSGVDFTHPSILNKMAFVGDGVTLGWHDSNAGMVIPEDTIGHGTHTIGTMVGNDDNSASLQIGVAPGAKYYACRIFGPYATTVATTLDAGEWMMDPDNNPATNDMPHVINNSWGVALSTNDWYWRMVNTWRAAGIFPVFSSGNNGPGDGTTGAAGNYPQSMSVGATDNTDAIASFSSRGPVTYNSTEYVKPDISAPGVYVISARATGTDMYGDGLHFVGPLDDLYWSNGTSMAAPHVAGIAALTLQEDPSLDVDALQRKLEASCLDLGAPGKDNSFGWGRIDAVDAIRHPYVYSSDASGGAQSLFMTTPGEDLFCSAGQLAGGQTVDIYVVDDLNSWVLNQAIPVDVSGGIETVTADGNGELTGVTIWAGPIPEGDYDIVLDVDQDGFWDASDAIDHLDRAGCRALGEVLLGSYSFPKTPDTSHFVTVTPGSHLRLHTDSGGCRNFRLYENGDKKLNSAYWTDLYFTPSVSEIELHCWCLTQPITIDVYETIVPNASHTPALAARQESPSVLIYYEEGDGQVVIAEGPGSGGAIPYAVGSSWSITYGYEIMFGSLDCPVPAETDDPEQLRLWREDDGGGTWTLIDRTPNVTGDSVAFDIFELGHFQLAQEPQVIATNEQETDLDLIWLDEPVYATGHFLPPNQSVDLYLVSGDSLIAALTPLIDASGGVETVTTNALGDLPLTEIWASAVPGHWRLVVDVNRDHYYDAGDALDNPVVNAFTVSDLYTIEATCFETSAPIRTTASPIIITGYNFNAFTYSYLDLHLVEGSVSDGASIPERVPFSEPHVYIESTGEIGDPVGNLSYGAVVTMYSLKLDQIYTIVLDVDGDGIYSSTWDRKLEGVYRPTTGVDPDDGDIPARSYLSHNYPNPFNPRTTIRYGLSQPAVVHLDVYDVSGRLVRVLQEGALEAAGRHETVWDGCDELGRPISAGVYFYRLTAGDFVQTKRMMLIK